MHRYIHVAYTCTSIFQMTIIFSLYKGSLRILAILCGARIITLEVQMFSWDMMKLCNLRWRCNLRMCRPVIEKASGFHRPNAEGRVVIPMRLICSPKCLHGM